MQKLRKSQALTIYHQELEQSRHNAVYEPKLEDSVRSEAATLDWWLSKLDDGDGETPRTKALLRAYLRIANGDENIEVGQKLPAQGLRIAPKGRWFMDKWVIAKAYQNGWLTFEDEPEGMYEPAFVLTKIGRDWINV